MIITIVVACSIVIAHVYYSYYFAKRVELAVKKRLTKKLFALQNPQDRKSLLRVLTNNAQIFSYLVIFVGLGGEFAVEITKITENKHYQNNIENIKKINELSGMYLTSGKGITDYSEHKCEVIVNTTFNVEGKFIGSRGLSGFICQRTGSGKNQIQKEIKECISEFNKRLKK